MHLSVHSEQVKPRAILVDIDGTVALRGARDPYDMDHVLDDMPNEAVITVVKALHAQGYTIVFLSGRFERARADTQRWLNVRVGIEHGGLWMRRDSDMRADWKIKKELYEKFIASEFDVRLVLDDRDTVVRMWRSQLKLPCLQVADGDF